MLTKEIEALVAELLLAQTRYVQGGVAGLAEYAPVRAARSALEAATVAYAEEARRAGSRDREVESAAFDLACSVSAFIADARMKGLAPVAVDALERDLDAYNDARERASPSPVEGDGARGLCRRHGCALAPTNTVYCPTCAEEDRESVKAQIAEANRLINRGRSNSRAAGAATEPPPDLPTLCELCEGSEVDHHGQPCLGCQPHRGTAGEDR